MTKSLLLIDDDTLFCQTLLRSLARREVNARSVHSLAELEQPGVQQNRWDYIVVDLNLGADSGLEVLGDLRARWPDARILVLTGYASIATTVQAIKAGADNYLAKPANTTSILAALLEGASQPVSAPQENAFEPMSVRRLEWEHIQQVLQNHGGNISAAARALNMHRRTLQRKLAKRPVAK